MTQVAKLGSCVLTHNRFHSRRFVHAQCVHVVELRQQLHWEWRCTALHADSQRGFDCSASNVETEGMVSQVTDADEAFANFDYASALRLAQAELQALADQYNITATTEAAPQTTTYSLVAPSSGWQTASPSVKTYVYSSGSAAAAASTPTPTGSSSSSDSDSNSKHNSGDDDDRLGNDLAANLASSDADNGSGDWSALLRNSYIIIGLLGGAICLLLGLLIRLVVNSRNNKYRVATAIPAGAFGRPYEPEKDEAFTTPYDDLSRPTGSH